MESLFFGIIDINIWDFFKMSEENIKANLIEKGLYVKGKSENHMIQFKKTSIPDYNAPDYIGQDFSFNNINYCINPLFVDELFIQTKKAFEMNTLLEIKKYLQNLKKRKVFMTKADIEELQNQNRINKRNSILNSVYEELNEMIESDIEYQENQIDNILKKYISVITNEIVEYMFGIDNMRNSEVFRQYSKFLRHKGVDDIFREIDIVEITKGEFSVPKRVALLSKLGVLELDYIKKATIKERNILLAIILGLDYNSSTDLRKIEGNLNVLNPNSLENMGRYTSFIHLDSILEVIKNLK